MDILQIKAIIFLSFIIFPHPIQRYKSPYFRLKTVISTNSDNHFQPMAQPKKISRLQASASTTLTDGTLLLYGYASGSFYDYPLALFILRSFYRKIFQIIILFCCFWLKLFFQKVAFVPAHLLFCSFEE